MSLFYKNQQKNQQTAPTAPAAGQAQISQVRPYTNKQTFPPKRPHRQSQQLVVDYEPVVVDPTFPRKAHPQQSQHQKLRGSIILNNKEDEKESWWSKCCSCTKLETLQKFFHVTNSDVVKRIMFNLQFWTTGFFAQNQEYDFYGPFWIYTTVIFCLSAVPNILLYQGIDKFYYNFEIVGLAFGFIYVEGFLFPIILTFFLKSLSIQCTYIQNVCLYGYSMCNAIICLLLCSFNVCILHYVLLGYAFATKAWFILHNMLASYPIPIPKKAIITILVAGEAALQFFVVKIFFISCVNDQAAATNTQSHYQQCRTFEI